MNSSFTSSVRNASHAAILIVGVAGIAAATGQPWVFPSLGPTAMLAAYHPSSTRPFRIIGGHFLGVFMGCLGYWVEFGVASHHRVVGSAIAVFGTTLAMDLLRCRHPPAVATTLILVLGGLQLPDPVSICIGVTLLALLIPAVQKTGVAGST